MVGFHEQLLHSSRSEDVGQHCSWWVFSDCAFSLHPCSRLDERDSHACYSVVWLYVLDNEGWALMFCKWVIRWLLKYNQGYWGPCEFINPHPHCFLFSFFGSVANWLSELLSLLCKCNLCIWHSHDFTIFSTCFTFLLCFSSCSCIETDQKTPLGHVHFIAFISFSWLLPFFNPPFNLLYLFF